MRLDWWFSLLTSIVLQVLMVSLVNFISLVGILFTVTYGMLFLIILDVLLCLRIFRVLYWFSLLSCLLDRFLVD